VSGVHGCSIHALLVSFPLTGFLFGSFALRLVSFKRYLFAAGCVLLACTGGFYLFKALVT